MIGILVVAHEPVASSFGMAIRHVLGKTPPQAAWLDVAADAAPNDVLQRIRALLTELDSGSGVLVCCDICGATPTNIASQLSEPGKVHVVSGLNLPMLLRALNYRDKSLEELTEKALTGGASGVMRMEPDNAAK
jgi:mannose PTS system EIIA component